MILVAALAAALAVLLALPPPTWRTRRRGLAGAAFASVAAAVATLTVVHSPGAAALAGVVGLAALGAVLLLRRRRRRQVATSARARVLETCELLAAELGAGQPPGRALWRSARAWPSLLPVAQTHDLGGDVPTALRELASEAGLQDLRLVAAAWTVAHRTGGGLADAVQRCAESIRAAQSTRLLVAGELASARSTARVVAGLPVLALLMGAGTGGDPLGFLLGHPLGLACLIAGLTFGFAGLWWIEAIADDVDAAT